MTGWHVGLLGMVWLGWSGAAAAAAPADDLCARLFVPEGYELRCLEAGGRAEVRPAGGAFAPLSQLTLRRIEQPIADQDAWLRQQLTLDVASFNDAFDELLRSADSPLADTPVAEQLETWRGALAALAGWPLNGCADPALVGDATREMVCTWQFGPFEQYMTLRLVTRDEQVFALEIRAMNPKRLRHLTAIANSF